MSSEKTLQAPKIITFGCRLNSYESEVMRGHATTAGLNNAVIINTCAVTNEAERQARQAIRKARREHPDAKIIVTGCAAQTNPDQFKEMAEVDQILGNLEKLEAVSFGLEQTERVQVNDIMSAEETASHLIEGFEGRARAFLQIQNGCNHRCTFCIIPYGRGNSRSVPLGAIVEQAKSLTQNGYREFVLTGVDITAYGEDLPGTPTLGQMCRRLLAAVPEIERLRLSSLDPVEVDDDLWRLIEHEDRLMPHLHISLQAGDDMILKRMKRRHLRDDVYKFVEKARPFAPMWFLALILSRASQPKPTKWLKIAVCSLKNVTLHIPMSSPIQNAREHPQQRCRKFPATFGKPALQRYAPSARSTCAATLNNKWASSYLCWSRMKPLAGQNNMHPSSLISPQNPVTLLQ